MTGKIRALARDVVRKKKEISVAEIALRQEIKDLNCKRINIARDLKTSNATVSLFIAGKRPLPAEVFKRMEKWRAS